MIERISMGVLWVIIIAASLVYAIISGSVQGVLNGISDAAASAIQLCINLCGIFAIWSGIMSMAKQGGILNALSKALDPIISKLFKTKDPDARQAITMNITANVLGMGSAATPAGQRAVKELNKNNKDKSRASSDTVMLLILNNSALTLIPTTVLTLRAAAGSQDAAMIIPYAIAASVISTIAAIILGRVFK